MFSNSGQYERVLFTATQLHVEAGTLHNILHHGDQLQFHAVPQPEGDNSQQAVSHYPAQCQWVASLVWRGEEGGDLEEKVSLRKLWRETSLLILVDRWERRDRWSAGRQDWHHLVENESQPLPVCPLQQRTEGGAEDRRQGDLHSQQDSQRAQ